MRQNGSIKLAVIGFQWLSKIEMHTMYHAIPGEMFSIEFYKCNKRQNNYYFT